VKKETSPTHLKKKSGIKNLCFEKEKILGDFFNFSQASLHFYK